MGVEAESGELVMYNLIEGGNPGLAVIPTPTTVTLAHLITSDVKDAKGSRSRNG